MATERALPLAGVRVLEWAEGIAGPTAGWLLAECGADVIKVERPQGDRLRESLGFEVLNRNKRGVVLELDVARDRERFRSLAAAADVVLVDEIDERLGFANRGERDDDRIWCALRAFPAGAPWATLPPADALIEALGGISAMQWCHARTPVHLVTPIASYASGFLAALGIVAALFARGEGGGGQRVDTDGVAAALLLQSGTYVRGVGHEGSLAAQAHDPRGVFPSYGLYQTADGWIFVGALTETFWTTLATELERTDLLTDPDLPQNPMAFGKPEIRTRLRGELEPIFRSRPTDEWLRRFYAADIPIGRVQSRRDALAEPTARETGTVIDAEDASGRILRQPGAPVIFHGSRPRALRPAPRLDREADPGFGTPSDRKRKARRRSSPLEGARVLDLTSFIAGPLCPMLLADLGADVVKIESPRGDPFRIAEFGFEGWNRGKRSLALDLKQPSGVEAFLRLAERADAVIENFRPGVLDGLGLGYATLRRVNPRIVHVSISGFGTVGPESGRPGFDPVMQARSGLCRAQGGADEPVLHQVAYTDYMTGTLAALATVAALGERTEHGEGRFVEVSLHRTAYAMQAGAMVEHDGEMEEVSGGRDLVGLSAAERAYAARDGWLCVAAGDERAAAGLIETLDLRSPVAEVLAAGAESAVATRIAEAIAPREREELLRALRQAGVPAVPCLTFAEIFTEPTLRRLGAICDVDHPRLGTISTTGPFLRFSRTACVLPRAAPALGEHGREILAECGFDADEIGALTGTGGGARSHTGDRGGDP